VRRQYGANILVTGLFARQRDVRVPTDTMGLTPPAQSIDII
jgi:hypothetical protein